MESSRSQGKNGVSNAVVKVGALTPHPRNYNQHSPAQVGDLRRSLKRFGQVRSIVVQAQADPGRWLIVAGHGIVQAARAEGIESLRADIIPADWDDAMVLAYLAADNELARQGQPDEAQLAALLRDVAAQADRELAALAAGSEARLTEMLATLDGGAAGDAEPQVDRAAELNEKWQVAPGDLWRIGEHRLACGDCTDKAVVERVMTEQANMIIADPPYGVNIVAANVSVGGGESANGMIPFGGVKGRKGFVGGGEGDSLRHGHYAIEEHGKAKRLGGSDGAAKPFGSKNVRGSYGATNMVDVGKYVPIVGDDTTETAIRSSGFYLGLYPGAAQFWWGGNYYADKLKASSCWVVWDKETTGNFADCELAWSNLDRSAKLFRHRWNGMLRDSERERRMHPSQKPAALAAFLMTEFGKTDDVVLDPFAGAGWVIVACQNLRRRGRGIEISPEYCAVVLERMATAFPGIEIERLTPRAGMDLDDEAGRK